MAGLARGINAGLTQGLNIGLQLQGMERQKGLDAEAAEDRQFRRGLLEQDQRMQQATFDAQQQDRTRTREREDAAGILKLTGEQLKGLQNQLTGLKRAGRKDDDPEAQYTLKQINELRRRERDTYLSLYGDKAKQVFMGARSTLADLQAGKRQIADLKPGELYTAVSVAAQRDARELASPEYGAAITGFDDALEQAVQGGDSAAWNKALGFFNEIAKSEIGMAVGQLSPDGIGRITGQRIERIVPHPDNPEYVLLDLENEVEAADGRKGKYNAPMTANRATDDDELKPFKVSDLMEYAGRMGELHGMLQDPEVAAKLAADAESGAADEFGSIDQALRYYGYDPATIEFGELKEVPAGDRIAFVDKTGVERRSIKKGAPPGMFAQSGGGGRGALSRDIEAIREEVANGTIPPEQGDELIREALETRGTGRKGGKNANGFENAGKVKLLNGQADTESNLMARYKTKYLDDFGEPKDKKNPPPDFDAWRDSQVQEPFRSSYRPPAADEKPRALTPLPETIARPQSGPVRVTTVEEARKLPKGTQFVSPDGKVRVVP